MSKPTIFAIAPAVRSVVIDVRRTYDEEGEKTGWEHQLYPIVALEWAEGEGGAWRRPLIFMPEEGPEVYSLEALIGPSGVACAVSCPWPESEDEERLRPHVERLARGAGRDEEMTAALKASGVVLPPGAGHLEKAQAFWKLRKAEGGCRMSKDIASALRDTLISPNVSDSNMEPANVVDVFAIGLKAIAIQMQSIGTHLKYLGAGDNGSQMGAVEFHGVCVKEAGEAIAGAIHDLADAIERAAEGRATDGA